MKALVTGGYYDDAGDGVVWWVDLASGRSEVLARWEPPAHLRVPAKGLAGASMRDGTLYAAAHAAVVRIDVARATVTGVMHQPCMNDLHHVAVVDERLVVSNTGLGSVDVFGLDGCFLGSHALVPGWTTARRMSGQEPPAWSDVLGAGWAGSPPANWPAPADDTYYSRDLAAPFHQRKVRDHLHVNHVASHGGRLIATCFADGSLRDLGALEIVWQRAGAFLHDGVVDGGSLWLTAIDGTVLELDVATFGVKRELRVFDTGRTGWCRGLALRGEQLLVVGLSEVRRERLPRHRWAERDPDESETSVLLLDRRDGRLLARVDLTDRARHSKLYSVIPLEDAA